MPVPAFSASLLLVALAVAGCTALRPELMMGPVDRMIPPQPDKCNAALLVDLQGQDFTSLADRELVSTLRVLWPAQQVSGDLDSRRLNALVDTQGRIKRLFCG